MELIRGRARRAREGSAKISAASLNQKGATRKALVSRSSTRRNSGELQKPARAIGGSRDIPACKTRAGCSNTSEDGAQRSLGRAAWVLQADSAFNFARSYTRGDGRDRCSLFPHLHRSAKTLTPNLSGCVSQKRRIPVCRNRGKGVSSRVVTPQATSRSRGLIA